jgi:hypothetical protein
MIELNTSTSQNSTPQVTFPLNVRLLIGVIAIVFFGLGFLTSSFFKSSLKSATNVAMNEKLENTPSSTSLTEFSFEYSVNYPADFFVDQKDMNVFSIANKKWQGQIVHYPIVLIETKHEGIPNTMRLREWLDGVSDPVEPTSPEKPKDCTKFLQSIKAKNIESGQFNCLYSGVKDIKETTFHGMPAITFTSQGVSTGTRHTVAEDITTNGDNILFDIQQITTGLSDEENPPETAAYQMFLDSFKLLEN